ncbi:hypothetical protein THAOC_26075, partial [Thalassiosira oceanica]
MDNMRAYIDCLGDDFSPDTGGDLPSRALRCLFALSESSGSRAERLAMVGGEYGPMEGEAGKAGTRALVPALLSFLGRCPRDSSEQYLTLLVLNNLSIPAANKRAIAIGHGGAAALGSLLCRDPGCHLLVIILVNLTFGDRSLNLDLVRRRKGGRGEEREAGPLDFLMRSLSGGEGEADGANAGEEFEDPQLIECICYALLLSSLTSDQLEKLGPIPLEDEDGSARRPADLLAFLTSMLSDEASADLLGPLDVACPDRPFPETARWCMSALKNLTRPGALAPSRRVGDGKGGGGGEEEADAAEIASRAILDAGMLPLLAGILLHGTGGDGGPATPPDWGPNTLQDSALGWTAPSSCPGSAGRGDGTGDTGPGAPPAPQGGELFFFFFVLPSSGRPAFFRRRVSRALSAGLTSPFRSGKLGAKKYENGGQRMALCYLLDSLDTDDRHSSNLITDREAGALADLLSDTLAGRARDGPGGYSAAAFGAKGVLYAVRCLLAEPRNRALVASSAHGIRLNALLAGAASRLADGGDDGVDAEAAEHAAVSLYRMTAHSLDEAALGFDTAMCAGPFLPTAPGAGKADTVAAVAGALSGLAAADGATAATVQAA